jgi:hypothetical protein
MRSKSRAKRSNTELNPLIGDFINTIDPTATLGWYLEWRQRAAPRLGFGPVQKTPTSIMRTFHAISGFIRAIPG